MSKDGENNQSAEKPKTAKVAVPTQKTFIFKGSSTEKDIDYVINPWLKQMSLAGQTPFLGKVTTQKRLFFSRIIYVFMFSAFVEVPKK